MSHTTADLRRKIDSARDLQAVVHTMKAMAAASVCQYEQAVQAGYAHSIEQGLSIGLPDVVTDRTFGIQATSSITIPTGVVVFGSDQGLVGQFKDVIAEHTLLVLADDSRPPFIWAVGERVHARLNDAGLVVANDFSVPSSVQAITVLIGQILTETEAHISRGKINGLSLIYNRPMTAAAYAPTHQRFLPLDAQWCRQLAERPWPTNNLPEVIGTNTETLQTLVREYLFVSLFRACAESLASENTRRLAAMQRADKNIAERLKFLHMTFNREHQSGIDAELFDVIAGFEALPTH